MTKTKTLDAMEMKERGERRVYERVRDMSVEEEVAFWKERTEALEREIQARKRRRCGES